MNSEITHSEKLMTDTKGTIIMKKMLSLLLAVLLIFSLTACSDKPRDQFWVAGKMVSAVTTVNEFPVIFPELYRDFFDPEDSTHKVIAKSVSATSASGVFYKAGISPSDKEGDTYQQARVSHFTMFRGQPGYMRAWGVTFGQTREEAETAIREYIGKETSKYGGKIEDLLTEKEQQDLGYADANLSVTCYGISGGVLYVAYLDGKVCGIMLTNL